MPTDPLTPARLRELADKIIASLRAYADLLDAPGRTCEAQNCENCRFVGNVPSRKGRFCYLTSDITHGGYNWVPLTIDGRPFKCEGWQAKESR